MLFGPKEEITIVPAEEKSPLSTTEEEIIIAPAMEKSPLSTTEEEIIIAPAKEESPLSTIEEEIITAPVWKESPLLKPDEPTSSTKKRRSPSSTGNTGSRKCETNGFIHFLIALIQMFNTIFSNSVPSSKAFKKIYR